MNTEDMKLVLFLAKHIGCFHRLINMTKLHKAVSDNDYSHQLCKMTTRDKNFIHCKALNFSSSRQKKMLKLCERN